MSNNLRPIRMSINEVHARIKGEAVTGWGFKVENMEDLVFNIDTVNKCQHGQSIVNKLKSNIMTTDVLLIAAFGIKFERFYSILKKECTNEERLVVTQGGKQYQIFTSLNTAKRMFNLIEAEANIKIILE